MMAEFLKSQLDYIFFFYGLAFLLLVPISLFLRRWSYRKLPWIWLVLFGTLHGANEWLDLLALSLAPGPAFDYIKLAILLMSYVCLLEFGRAGTYNLCARGPGPWILAVIIALIGIGGLAGYPGLLAATRYVLGLTGGMWAAAALALLARTEVPNSWSLRAAALGMAGYALATGLVVPPAPFFPASWVNYDSFITVTAIPIQLVRGLLAVEISVSLCLFAETSLEKEPQFRAWFRKMMLVAMTLLTLCLVAGWALTQHLGNDEMRDKWEDYEHDAEFLSLSLANKIEETDRLVKLMGGFPAISSALANDASWALYQANVFLDICSQSLPETVCYLMDLQGLTIASSNRNHLDSFLGESYAFRPFFQQAIQGSTSRYWALGVTDGKLGYYTSVPVRDRAGQILGAAVIKKNFSRIETSFIHYHDLGLIIDQHGLVLMANQPSMVLRSLWPLSAATREELVASRQYGNGPFIPILARRPGDKSEILFNGKRMLALIRPIHSKGCFVVILGAFWPVAQVRLFGIGATLLLFLALIGYLATLIVMRESEEGFRQLFENANDSLILHDKGRILEVNQQACRSLLYTRGELLQKSIFDIEVGFSKDFLMDLWEQSGDVVTLSGIYRRKDGLTFPAEVRAGEIIFRGQTLRLATARDVSERKQAEEALRESEEYYRSLFNNMLNGYAYCQMYFEHGQPVDFIFLNVNKAFGDLTGLGDVIGKKVSEVIPSIKSSNPESFEMFGRVALTGQHERAECYVKSLQMWFSISVYSPLKEYFVVIFDIITERKRAEEALRTSEAALRQSQERYRMLAGHLLTAQEAERKRLARELHDDLSQRLAALAMEAETLGHQKSPKTRIDRVKLKQMKEKLVELSIDVHAMSRRLHPSILDDLGLVDAVASECDTFWKRNGVVVNFRADNINRVLPPDVAVCLYRIVQEALRNISRHAGATEVMISLMGENHTIRLLIEDNGKGFEPRKETNQVGLGLDSMEERAHLIGGNFSIKSKRGQGTIIEVMAPLSGRLI
jgi:PAS domain S-box-containing protein